MLSKALAPNAPTIAELAKKAKIPYNTLHKWISMKKRDNTISTPTSAKSSQVVLPDAKFKAVTDTINMATEELNAYCRSNGFYPHHLIEWKQQILSGLAPINNKKETTEYRNLVIENKTLKKELYRKDRALAETSALLILKKKANLLWGDDEDD